jgi:hypothetical protein
LSSEAAVLTRRALALAPALAALISASTAAAPVMQYSWDDCSPVVPSRSFTTPTVVTQAVSVLGLDQPIESFRLIVRISGPYSGMPEAWRFSDLCTNPWFECSPPHLPPYGTCCGYMGTAPCQPIGRVAMLLAGSGCDTIPGLRVSAHYDVGIAPPLVWLIVEGTAEGSFMPDASRRYTLIRMAFDHSGSVAGDAGAGTCGHVDRPLLFEIGELSLNRVDQRGRVTWENCVLGWNAQTGNVDCPLVVPVRNRSWSQIKTLYR